MISLNNFKKKIHSQNGEDGIIEEILNRLNGELDHTCCEFGAWDGIHLSNVYNLVEKKDYKVLFIEGDQNKFGKLEENFKDKKAINLNKYVSFEGKNTLDQILSDNKFNTNFDLLSIDIDGNDYHVFDSLEIFKPKVIIIEFNPKIPNEVEFVQKKDIKINQGSSSLSFFKLAKRKNYTLVAATEINLFFIHNDYANKVTDKLDPKLDEIVDDTHHRNFIFTGFDGKIFTSKKFNMPWHKIDVDEFKILPNFLQKFPDNYNLFERIIFRLYKFYINPKKLFKKLASLFSKK